jgi:hypothetical protein
MCKHTLSQLIHQEFTMATTETKNGGPTIEAGFAQLKELNEQFLGAARRAGTTYLDSYEDAVDRAVEFELKFAGLTQQEWLKDLVQAQTKLTRDLTSSYTNAARSLLQ